MSFSPVLASKNIYEKYKRYLNTIFQIKDSVYSKQFREILDSQETFANGPYLDVTDSFEKSKSLNQMINDGILPKSFNKLHFPMERNLYIHQDIAITKISKGENLVVSTGTGSGKTESFLIPILSELVKEYEQGVLDSGVRALLIYPMNALANDQIERLRTLLADFPEITYGSYTGQTKEKYKEALTDYKSLNEGSLPQENELISREQMKKTPPNILITNYAMLEYLMLRPDDNIFFVTENSQKWKFIVLDEAHVYNGSTGIEVAMLLRRLKATLNNQNIQYILTSATLGAEDENDEVANFAQSLCDGEFKPESIVRAKRIAPKKESILNDLGYEFYNTVANLIDNNELESVITNKICDLLDIELLNRSLEEILYDIVLNDKMYWDVRERLIIPKTVYELANSLGCKQNNIANFVTVASRCEKNNDKLFDSRYHMFLKATESVFITLKPNAKLFLNRKDIHYESNGLGYKVFEIATCSSCHAIYLVGEEKNHILCQSSNIIEPEKKSIFLLGDKLSDTDEDHLLLDEKIETEEYLICPRCGFLHKANLINPPKCEHSRSDFVKIIRVKVNNETGKLTKCIECENTNNYGILRMFFSGQEAVTSVIGTALFEELPSYNIVKEQICTDEDDEFGFGEVLNTTNENKVSETAKQFIAFSDSRQAAAYYATYLNQTYKSILYKRLIVETLNNTNEEKIYFNRFIKELSREFTDFDVIDTKQENSEKEATKAFLSELVDINSRNSLYSMGLLGLSLCDENLGALIKLKLEKNDVTNILNVFTIGMFSDAAIFYKCKLDASDKEFFTNNSIECVYTFSDSESKKLKKSFIPTKIGMRNKRIDYLQRVLTKLSVYKDDATTLKLMKQIWEIFLLKGGLLVNDKNGYKVNAEKIVINKNNKYYICPKCHKITMYNVQNVCPSYKCDGELKPIDIKEHLHKNHYYNLYQDLDIRKLRVVEHTAQLDKKEAYGYQKQFKNKEIDVLSCSTTFEMGVDVGSLETVFMRNMPPSPANYAQRAGRAGRSSKSAAFALTFCNKSNHDFSFFKTPEKMIKGKINPPKFNIENEKIAIRHLFASSFSFFWKLYPEYFSVAEKMIELGGLEKYQEYISTHPEDFKIFALKFLPNSLSKKFGVEEYSWTDKLLSDDSVNTGVLQKAANEYNYEVGILEDARIESVENQSWDIGRLSQRIKTYKKESILAFFSRKNVLPKYGFPVDSVELKISGDKSFGLQLQRDLEVAISEYAPSSQIVANGNLLTSRYIRKIPKMSWKMYQYKKCPDCQTLNIIPYVNNDEEKMQNCSRCGVSIEDKNSEIFIIPEFGFETEIGAIKKPNLIKPDKTYKGEISYIGKGEKIFENIEIGHSNVEFSVNHGDEMAVLNTSNFYVCEDCGYTELDKKCYTKIKRSSHKKSNGYPCKNDGQNILKRFSLGYRFETDVAQIRFTDVNMNDHNTSISILFGLLIGICSALNIEQSDISGCLQYYYNEKFSQGNFSIILFDKTPGGAGYVKKIGENGILEKVLKETNRIMMNCNCGGETKDSSCYSCLRSYYNQNYHDILNRSHVIDFVDEIFK